MAVESLTLYELSGKDIHFRLTRPADERVFDFHDNTWKVDLAACTEPRLPAVGAATLNNDATTNDYTASFDVSNANDADAPIQIVVQAIEGPVGGVVLSAASFWIAEGEILGRARTPDLWLVSNTSVSAIQFGRIRNGIVVGTVVAGTLTTTQMTTNLAESSDDSFGGAAGRIRCVFRTGLLKGQSRPIIAYAGSAKMITVSPAYTAAPKVDDVFAIPELLPLF